MKKLILLVALLCLFQPALAEEQRCSIRDLPSVTAPRWQQTYEAHGRVIAVDVEVRIPDAEAAPVLLVKAADPIAEPAYSRLKNAYEQAKNADLINRYSFLSNDFRTGIVHAYPPAWGETRNSEFVAGVMGQSAFDLSDYHMDEAYAENNPLTVSEAVSIVRKQAAELFPNDSLDLRNITVWSGTYWLDTGEPIRQQGSYDLQLSQVFHGIPFLACVQSAYSTLGNENIWLKSRGLLHASVMSADEWSLSACLYQEKNVLHNDIPLLSFDAVKAQVEALISSGHVRMIDQAGLGYVQFDTDDPEVQALAPAWVIWCEYHKDGAQSERAPGINDTGLLYQNSDYYRPLIINAQTGEMLDPENKTEGRCLCPPIIPW